MPRFSRFGRNRGAFDVTQNPVELVKGLQTIVIAVTIVLLLITFALGTVFGCGAKDIHMIIGKGDTLEKQIKATKKRMLLGFGISGGLTFLMSCMSGYAAYRMGGFIKQMS